MYLGLITAAFSDSPDSSLVWASGVPVSNVPAPDPPTFAYACIYSDGSQELTNDPSNCPVKDGVYLNEVDDLSQVSSGTPQPTSPAIIVNVPEPTLPPIAATPPILPPMSLPPILQPSIPAPPIAAPGPAPAVPWWLVITAAGILLTTSVQRRRRRVSR